MKEQDGWSFGQCVLGGAFAAAAFSVLAILGISMYFAMRLFGAPVEPTTMREIAVALPLVFFAYFAGGLVAGAGFWLLQPLRPSLFGWVLTGMLIAAAAYGFVGLSAVLAYAHLGVNMMDYESVEEAWRSLPVMTGALSVLAGIPGGFYYWWNARQS